MILYKNFQEKRGENPFSDKNIDFRYKKEVNKEKIFTKPRKREGEDLMKYFNFYKEYNLLVFRPNGILDHRVIREYYEMLKELGGDQCLKRLIDFNELEHLDFGFNELIHIKGIRDEANKEYTVLSQITLCDCQMRLSNRDSALC